MDLGHKALLFKHQLPLPMISSLNVFKCKPFLKLFAFIDNKVHALIASLIFFSSVVNSFNDISMKSVSILYGECNIKKPAGNVIINIIKSLLD